MIKIRFLRDYRGELTKEIFYNAGDTLLVSAGIADKLVQRGAVEIVTMAKITPSIHDMETDQLRERAKKNGVRGYGRMKRETLIERLS